MEITCTSPFSLSEISPFSPEPIKTVPQYVFENCNQVTCNQYKPFYLSLLRERAKVITAPE